jgi:hypothetical protein
MVMSISSMNVPRQTAVSAHHLAVDVARSFAIRSA